MERTFSPRRTARPFRPRGATRRCAQVTQVRIERTNREDERPTEQLLLVVHMSDGLKAIARTDPGLSLRVALAASPSESRDEFRTALADWLTSKSFHGPEKVIQALGYLNCQVTWTDLDSAAGRDTAKELTKITKDRHAIVHEGKKPYIKRDLAEQSNALVAYLARHIDGEVCKLYPPN